MLITVLGSGGSTGVPVPGCKCPVCKSSNPRNKRLRTSILVTIPNPEVTNDFDTSTAETETLSAVCMDSVTASSLELDHNSKHKLPPKKYQHPLPREKNILIDSGPDLRMQALSFGLERIDAVLYTHTHADHIFGMDDLRSFNFVQHTSIPLYAGYEHQGELKRIFSYIFHPNPEYVGGALPDLELRPIIAFQPFSLFGLTVTPVPLEHGLSLVYGFRIGDFAYLTDCSGISERSRQQLAGVKYVIIDGLRERAHRTHFNHEGALAELKILKPLKAYLTHVSHETDHDSANSSIRRMTDLDVELAWDGLQFEVP